MDDETATQGNKALLCPVCGSALRFERLEIDDEHGRDEVFTFDCPTGDFHRAVTQTQLREAAASALVASVQQVWQQSSVQVRGS